MAGRCRSDRSCPHVTIRRRGSAGGGKTTRARRAPARPAGRRADKQTSRQPQPRVGCCRLPPILGVDRTGRFSPGCATMRATRDASFGTSRACTLASIGRRRVVPISSCTMRRRPPFCCSRTAAPRTRSARRSTPAGCACSTGPRSAVSLRAPTRAEAPRASAMRFMRALRQTIDHPHGRTDGAGRAPVVRSR